MLPKNKQKDIVILSLMIITFLIVAGISLGLIDNKRILPSSPLTNDELVCYFNISSNSDVNITWYKGNSRNISTTISCTSGVECNSSGSGTVPKEYTVKGETWTCEIGYYNGTDYEVVNTSSVIIGDTAPLEPKVYWRNNGTEITNITINIAEDIISNFTVNTTDADTIDTISYSLNDTTFCTIPISTVGDMSCNPENESHLGPRSIKIYAESGSYIVFQIWNINITPTNDAPRFSPSLSNQNFTSLQIFNYYIDVSDDENNFPINLSVVSVLDENSNPGPTLNVVRINDTRFVLWLRNNETVQPSEAKHNYTVKLMLNDTDTITFRNQSINATFQLRGITVNQLPTISYRFLNVTSLKQGDNLSILINATDPDNNTLIFDSSDRIRYNITWNSSTDYNSTVINKSFAQAEINFTNLTNDHVIYRSFTVYALDNDGGNVSIVINVTIDNSNDQPIINEISYHNNTQNNRNLSNLTGYTGVLLLYKINATDVDDLTYDNASTGLGTYTTNDSLFHIDPNNGWLNFTINVSGNYSFEVNVTDRYGSTYSRTANITILANQIPTFLESPIIINCYEMDPINSPQSCFYNISANVSEPDIGAGDYIANYWTNSSLFTINDTTGLINFTANQSLIGNYTILLNVTDSRGGSNSTIINLVINNTNNAPNMSYPDFPSGNWLVGNWYSITYHVSDLDLDLPAEYSYEELNFTYDITGPNTSIFQFAQADANTSTLLIQSEEGFNHDGNYTINMTVTDKYNNQSSRYLNITLYNKTALPIINQIIPSGTPLNNISINNLTWENASTFISYYGRPITNISIFENQTFIFNITATYDLKYPNHLDYQWYYDDILMVQTQHYQHYSDFFSAGTHNITVILTDQYNSSTSFTWYINVTDVNRWPIYDLNSLQDLNISADTTIQGYMTNQDGRRRFFDPDDDPTAANTSSNYTNHSSTDSSTNLTFSSTTCEFANFTFPGHQLQITTISVGLCNVTFFAYDPRNISMIVTSDDVLINITNITQTRNNPIIVPINVQSTGGGTNTQPVPLPYPLEVEKPKPLSLITPKLVTTYKNATIQIPIVINNTWNGTLVGITLEAATNSSNVSLYLDKMYIPKLNKGESVEAILHVKNYKSEGHYEIQVRANVTVPEYMDTATIFINSAEMRSEGDEVENKISFAKDLLSSNPECQELNELLMQAKIELDRENYIQTAKMIDSVINGCKYLVNNAKKNNESPSRNFIKTFEWKKTYNDYIIIGLFGVLFLASLYYILKKDNPEQDF